MTIIKQMQICYEITKFLRAEIKILNLHWKEYNFLYYQMPKRHKSDSCSKGWCNNHLFSLTPLKPNSKFKKIQKVRLCPKLNKSTNSFQQTIPLLNKDHKHYTPSFILEEEENFYKQNDDRMLNSHLERVQSMESGPTCTIVKHFDALCKRVFLVAKHGRKRKYCTVCQEQYEDYLEHISSYGHKEKIRRNKFMAFIHELCRSYSMSREKIAEPRPVEETEECLIMKYMMGAKSFDPVLIEVQPLGQQLDDGNKFD